MALRLTGSPLQPQGSDTTPAAPPAPAADNLALQARSALARGDIAAFTALFSVAGSVTDPHRRLHGRLALLEAGLAATPQASEGLATRVFVAVADAALGMLESEPAEPLVLNFAGVACYELWGLDAAPALFKAAR